MAKVYLINQAGTNLYKIGVANNVGRRLSSLQIGNPNSLRLILSAECVDSAYKVEAALHEKYKVSHKQGEWFELSTAEKDELLWWLTLLSAVGNSKAKRYKPKNTTSVQVKRFIEPIEKIKGWLVRQEEAQTLEFTSKADLARWWFEQHPEDREKSGRDLEESAKPGGETISYKYWNKIKKERGA